MDLTEAPSWPPQLGRSGPIPMGPGLRLTRRAPAAGGSSPSTVSPGLPVTPSLSHGDRYRVIAAYGQVTGTEY